VFLLNALPYTNFIQRVSTGRLASSKPIYFCFEVYTSAFRKTRFVVSFVSSDDVPTGQRHSRIFLI